MKFYLVALIGILLVASCDVKKEKPYNSLDHVLSSPVGMDLTENQKDALTRLEGASKKSLTLHVNGSLNVPVWLKLKYPVSTSEPVGAVKQFLADFGAIYTINQMGTIDTVGNYIETDSTILVNFNQKYNDIPVFAGGLQFKIDKQGWISEIKGLLFSKLNIPDRDFLNKGDAKLRLSGELREDEISMLPGEMAILDSRIFAHGKPNAKVTWHFAFPSDYDGLIEHWFVDAQSGALLNHFSSSPLITDQGVDMLASGDDWTSPQFHVNPETGAPDYLSWHHVGGYLIGKETEPASHAIMGFLKAHPEIFADADPERHQKIKEEYEIPEYGFTMIRTRQYYADLPVFGSGLRYLVAPGNRLWSIHGNYLPKLKVDTDTPTQISPNQAQHKVLNRVARQKCPECTESELIPIVKELESKVYRPELGLFPKTLAKTPSIPSSGPGIMEMPDPNTIVVMGTKLADLAYKVETTSHVYFIDARSGDFLYSYSLVATDGGHGEVKVYDANGAQEEDYTDNGGIDIAQADPSSSIDADVIAADNAAHTTLNYWYNNKRLFPYIFLDWAMDNEGEAVHLVVDADMVLASGPLFCNTPNAAHIPGSPDHMVFCQGHVDGDIVAHEMTHGLTHHSSGLIYADESGALNESYSDLFGELVFPDPGGTWRHGTTRDMASPAISHLANYRYPDINCVGNYDNLGCDYGGVHTNSGIPNLAAVYTADGVPELSPATGIIPGIGRDKTASLSFHTLVNILEEWSGFSDAMLATVSWCELEREWGASDHFDTPLIQDDCDLIVNAWSRVGISPTTSMGWYHSSGTFGASEDIEFGEGEMYSEDVGCTVRGYILKLTNLDDPGMRVACSDATICPPGGVVSDRLSYSNGEFWAKVNSWSEGSNEKYAQVHVGRSNFEDIAVTLEFVPTFPSGLTRQHCDGTVIRKKSHPIKRHWSNWGVGGKGDEWVGPEEQLPDGCVVVAVTLEKLASDHSQMATGYEVGNNNSGARIVSDPLGTTGRRVKVHWWFNSFNIIRYRVIYTVAVAPGTSCWP